jgi:predicted nucleotidyltransferase
LHEIEGSVPENVFAILSQQYSKNFPVTEEDFSKIIKYKLLSEDRDSLASYVDVSRDLADRFKNISDLNLTIMELSNEIKTKNMTLTRIQRALIHILLNIRSEYFTEYNANGYCPYARVLGIRRDATHLLRTAEKAGQIPIITKVSKAEGQLNALGYRMFSEDLFATHLYNQAVYEKYNTRLENEYKHGIIIL